MEWFRQPISNLLAFELASQREDDASQRKDGEQSDSVLFQTEGFWNGADALLLRLDGKKLLDKRNDAFSLIFERTRLMAETNGTAVKAIKRADNESFCINTELVNSCCEWMLRAFAEAARVDV